MLLVIGSGGLSREIRLLGIECGFERVRVISKHEDDLAITDLPPCECAIAIGHPEIKAEVAKKYGKSRHIFPNLVHPDASVDLAWNIFGIGNIFAAGARITAACDIGHFNLFNLNCTVGHDVKLGNCCVINPNSSISGGVEIGNNVLVGVGASILEGVKIGNNAIIGAGSVVLDNVPDHATMIGIPARRLK